MFITYNLFEYYNMLDDLVWFDKVHNEAFHKLNHNVYHLLVDMNKDYLYNVLFKNQGFKLKINILTYKLTTKMSFFIKTIITIKNSITKL